MIIVFLLLVHTISFIRSVYQLISKSRSHRNILLYFKRTCQNAYLLSHCQMIPNVSGNFTNNDFIRWLVTVYVGLLPECEVF